MPAFAPLLLTIALTPGAWFDDSPTPQGVAVDLPCQPAASPDGSWIVFHWRGDLWKVPGTGGLARRLTSDPGNDLGPAVSPEGSLIAFESDREGARDLWVMDSEGGNLRRVTDLDAVCNLTGFATIDGERGLLFDARLEDDLYRAVRPYFVPLSGGAPRRLHGAFGSNASAAPDGSFLFERGGSSWLRRHYRGPDQRDAWRWDPARGSFERLTDWQGNDGFARAKGDGECIFLSDRQGDTVNVFVQPARPGAEARPLTDFRGTDVQDLSVSGDGRTAYFTNWDRLYRLDLSHPGTPPVPLVIHAAADALSDTEIKSLAADASDAALNPDGTTMALVAQGDIWVRPVDGKSRARRVTAGAARESDLSWSPDGLTLYFVSDLDGCEGIYAARVARTRADALSSLDAPQGERHTVEPEGQPKPDRWADAVQFDISRVVTDQLSTPVAGRGADRLPIPSPDGKLLTFRRGRGDLMAMDLATGEVRRLREGWDEGLEWRFSPDSKWIAFAQSDQDFNTDIWLMPVDGSSPPINITRHPDNDTRPRFSSDGRILAFLSERTNEEQDVWMVFLDKSLAALPRADLEKHFKEESERLKKLKPLGQDAKAEAPASPTWSLDDAYLRNRRVTTMPGDESSIEVVGAGERLLFGGSEGGGGLYTIRFDGTDQKRIAGRAPVGGMSLGGDSVLVLSGGRATVQPVGGGEAKSVDVDASVEIDLRARAAQKFAEFSRLMEEGFYHPTMKDLDWDALTARYAELAARTRTGWEFDHVANRMLGELNASHTGVSSPRDREAALPQGRIGARTRPVEGGVEIVEVLPDGPAETARPPLKAGDIVTAVEFEPIAAGRALEPALAGTVGREVVLSIRRPAPDAAPLAFESVIQPCTSQAQSDLAYRATQRHNAQLVSEWSGGRLGYLHIQGMGQPQLDEFERDLYAAAAGKDGLLIDVRNNGGGWTADRVLASIMVTPHAYAIPRGGDSSRKGSYPQDRLFIQRYTGPLAMLCNEKSFSNAEIVSHAFKTLGRGPLVGQQTYGGVISTGSAHLIDGTTVRMPGRGWFLPDGTDMENHGAVPDILVVQTPEDEARGEDAQLRAAVEALLSRIDGKAP